MGRLHYTTAGEDRDPALLFLHGFMGSSADWVGVTSALEDRFYCIAPDLPGHGASLGLPSGSYSFDGAARTTIRVLDRLDIRRAAIVGYSMGGRLALYLALRYPERCTALFIESASPGLEDAAGREARRRSDGEVAARLESGDFEGFLVDWYSRPLFASLARREGLVEEMVAARRANDPAELARTLRGMGAGAQPSLLGELPDLVVPALAVAGDLDEKFGVISRRMAEASPNVRAASVAGAGHNVRAEASEAYLRLLEDFLGHQ
ncbi:MAG: 2-succinyl-6-hydroxy-2,4-cyclohexadiene-1-carboxylate synthase [Rubrobacter sp.]